MPIEVDDLVDEAKLLKAQIETLQIQQTQIKEQIMRNRDRLKVLNPLIALYDGDPVEIPQLDMRSPNGSRTKRKKPEPTPEPPKPKRKSTKGNPIGVTRWDVYPELCLLPENMHRHGQVLNQVGRGLCNAHVQRLRLGSMPEDQMAEYIRLAQEFAEANDFTLTEADLRIGESA
jgi:hypothetical protein